MADAPKKRILNVDDNDSGRFVVTRILRRGGFEVIEAATGEEALIRVAERPDLVLLDVNLPGIDGFEVCRRIKANPATASIPVVHLSATCVGSQSRVEGLDGGADGYLVQPVNPRELVSTVRAFLRIKQVETTLRQRENRLSAIINNLPGIVSQVDRNLRYLFASPGYERVFGIPSPLVVGRGMPEVLGDEAFALVEPQVQRVLAGEQVTFENPIRTSSGEVSYGLTTLVPDVNPAGEVDGFFIFALDITERKRAETALRESEDRYRDLVENSQDLICTHDLMGNLLSVNEAGVRVTGYSRDSLLRMNLTDLIVPELRSLFPAYLAQIRDRGRAGGIMRIQTASGETRFWEYNNTLRAAGTAVPMVRGMARDVTDRLWAEQALRASQLRLSAIVDSAMDGIVTVDDAERIILFNAAAERMFGCPAGEAIGASLERFIPERFHAAHHQHLQRFGRTSDTHRILGRPTGIRGLRASGEEFPIEASVSQTEVDGRMLFTVILRDVTEQVRNEESHAQLEARLRLAQRMDALGTLAGGIAHDFNNILGAISGNTELVRQDVGPNHPAMTGLSEIRKATQRAKDLVQRILAFGRPQLEGRGVIALGPVVEEAVALLRATLPAGIELTTALDAGTPTALADPAQIHQALMNLCTNAWQAIPGLVGRIDIGLDGVTLDAEAASANPDLSPGHFARLCITDNGSGMDAATLERIFDPFFTTKPVDQGTGLGLSVVHGIVQAHGGTITVTSQPGRGTTFTLYFPAAEAPGQSAAPDGAAPEILPTGAGQHVLYLDDEEPLVFLVTRMLERLGYQVSGYTRAQEALAAVRADPGQFDLVVTDLNMPGMSGLEVARELARLRPDLPVVLTSGYVTEETRAQASAAGVRQVVYKPNTVEELCAVVRRLAGEAKS